MGYDFQVEYKRGGENIVADALSRRFEMESDKGSLLAVTHVLPHWIESIQDEVKNDPQQQALSAWIHQGEAIGPWQVVNGIIMFKKRIYLSPESKLPPTIINEFHGSIHKGYVKTFQQIKSDFYWKGMRQQIKAFIRECDTC
ncbi:hypothetical protein ACOSQ3_022649 [Xanthoceras sorbifolium]